MLLDHAGVSKDHAAASAAVTPDVTVTDRDMSTRDLLNRFDEISEGSVSASSEVPTELFSQRDRKRAELRVSLYAEPRRPKSFRDEEGRTAIACTSSASSRCSRLLVL